MQEDPDIFHKAREADTIVMTKDKDFVELLERPGVDQDALGQPHLVAPGQH